MILYPAIDIYEGKAVRLRQGNYSEMTVYSDDPVSLAMSLSDNADERVEGELQSFLEEYKW